MEDIDLTKLVVGNTLTVMVTGEIGEHKAEVIRPRLTRIRDGHTAGKHSMAGQDPAGGRLHSRSDLSGKLTALKHQRR